VVVTNQSGIARGFMTRRDVDRVNVKLRSGLAECGVKLDRIEICPHHPDLTGPCACRKPAPGMLITAAHALDVDLGESWMIGDHETDLEAGRAAGCRTGLVLTGYGRKTRSTADGRRASITAGTLRAMARKILDYRGRARR
jgi:D-glycero-D-manno-heptose 1,7-bisphosphate phosphatase